MIVIEQVAIRTDDINAQLEAFAKMNQRQWVRDTVDAVHLYKHHIVAEELGEMFTVHLAFNYEFMPGMEFELIQLVSGKTVQISMRNSDHRTSHFGYHTTRDQSDGGKVDSLLDELMMLQSMGLQVLQVSQTVKHANTDRRYRYAFVTGSLTGGVPLKIIQRLLPNKHPDASVESGKELFACLDQ